MRFFHPLILGALAVSLCSCATKSTQPKVGFVGKEYYLSDAEKTLTPERLRERIQNDATVAAELRAKESQKAMARGAMQVGIGLATGNFNMNPVHDTPAARAKIKMEAYSNRLVELGQTPVDVEAVMKAAIADRRTSVNE